MLLSYTEENYLKALLKISLSADSSEVAASELAKVLTVKPGTANDMLKKLKEKKLVDFEKYGKIRLTDSGRISALQIIRKHRLWETFLCEKLDFDWDEVHEIAEQLEHIESDSLIEKLDAFLEFPKTDPHGDPIPNKNGDMPELGYLHLADIKAGNRCTLMGVAKDSAVFLQLLTKMKLSLGSTLQVQEVNAFDRSISVSIDGEQAAFISHEVAKNILVKLAQ
jgi:DtxR family Mn-dependent transcriptional regulator